MSETADQDAGYETLAGLIGELVEPAPPPPVSMMPQTWGWVGLALLLLGLGIWAFRRWQRVRRANAYRRAALSELAGAQTVAEIATLLRRTALAAYPRARVAGLAGADWLAFLAQSGGRSFSGAAGDELLSAPYRSGAAPASDDLKAAVRGWITQHRADGGVA